MTSESVLRLLSEHLRPLLALMLVVAAWSVLQDVLLNTGRRKRLKGRELDDELLRKMPEAAAHLAILVTGRNIRRAFYLGLACAAFTVLLGGLALLRTRTFLAALAVPAAFWLVVLVVLVVLRKRLARRVLRFFWGEWLDMVDRIAGREAKRDRPLVALASPTSQAADAVSTFTGPVSRAGPAPLEYWAVSGEQLLAAREKAAPWTAWAGIDLPGAWTSSDEAQDDLVRRCDMLLFLGRNVAENQPLFHASRSLRWDAAVRLLDAVSATDERGKKAARWDLDTMVVRDSRRREVNQACLSRTAPQIATRQTAFGHQPALDGAPEALPVGQSGRRSPG